MTFLRLLHEDAYQNFTYTCINSAAWYALKTSSYEMAIKLMGDDEQELTAELLKPYVVADGCKVQLILLQMMSVDKVVNTPNYYSQQLYKNQN